MRRTTYFLTNFFYPGFCLNFDPKCHFSQKHTPGLVSKRLRDFHFSRILTISNWPHATHHPGYNLYQRNISHFISRTQIFNLTIIFESFYRFNEHAFVHDFSITIYDENFSVVLFQKSFFFIYTKAFMQKKRKSLTFICLA